MRRFPMAKDITPEEFELTVKRWFESFSKGPLDQFEVKHLDRIQGVDGEYEIDVTARFKAFEGADFLVVCECKKHKDSIKREVVQVLNDRKNSVGAHKAMLVSTAPFQSGAQKYAEIHGIALITIESGQLAYITNSISSRFRNIPDDADPYVGLSCSKLNEGDIPLQLVSSRNSYFLSEFLKPRFE